ncbi:UNVERIFIED_CONTAM: DNA-binding protein DDB [Sesamum radiatum]|uniref:DNA-binding protein DDB n=1 Tax=Sesamum radiatum TaxID=300843 RepID=A0AAW2T1Z9_SESRA
MADPELEAIRQRRMQELMGQRSMGNNQKSEQQKAQEEAKREAEEQRQMILTQILTSEARARLARIALVKPEKARGVEDVIIRAAQMGQIVDQVSEERLISLLEQINTQTTKETKVTFSGSMNKVSAHLESVKKEVPLRGHSTPSLQSTVVNLP